jgi:hypothetical protein
MIMHRDSDEEKSARSPNLNDSAFSDLVHPMSLHQKLNLTRRWVDCDISPFVNRLKKTILLFAPHGPEKAQK